MVADILIVDDNEINLLVCEEIFSHYNVNTDTAESGQKAIRMASEKEYDIIFMDLLMPEMDGLEATKNIRKMSPYNKDTVIIALTADESSDTKDICIAAGMNDYLYKPIETDELSRCMKTWLSGNETNVNDPFEKLELTQVSPALEEALTKFNIDLYGAIHKMADNENIYISVLQTFVLSVDKKIDLLHSLLESGTDYDLYKVEVHGLKSALVYIGAEEMSEQARNLEIATKNLNISFIKENGPAFCDNLANLYLQLKPLFVVSEVVYDETLPLVEQDWLIDKLNQCEENILDLEDEAALAIIEDLISNYRHSSGILNELREIALLIEALEYSSVISKVNMLKMEV